MKRKLIACLLAAIMVFTMLPTTAFAEESQTVATEPETTAQTVSADDTTNVCTNAAPEETQAVTSEIASDATPYATVEVPVEDKDWSPLIETCEAESEDDFVPEIPDKSSTLSAAQEIDLTGTNGRKQELAATGADSKDNTCKLVVKANTSAGGTVTANPTGGRYTRGQMVTLTAVPNAGYSFDKWENEETDEEIEDISFSFSITQDTTWVVYFRKNGEYFIDVFAPSTVATLTADPLQVSYAPGTKVTLIAQPESGRSMVYEVWVRDDDAPNGFSFTRLGDDGVFTMPACDVFVRALHSRNIELDCGANGTATLSPGPYYFEDDVTLTCTPDAGYRLKTIYGMGARYTYEGDTYTFTMPNSDLNISVEFEPIPTASVTFYTAPYDSGTVSPSIDSSTQTVTATAIPQYGYHFMYWRDSETKEFLSIENPYTFRPTQAVGITAVFGVYVNVATNIPHGTVEVVDSQAFYIAGNTVQVLGHPDPGYLVDYYMAGEKHDGNYTLYPLSGDSFTMSTYDMAVSASFIRGCLINTESSPSTGGTVSGAGTYRNGDTVTLTAEPANGNTFTGWQENGAIVSTDRVYSFKASSDRTLTACFQSYEGMEFTIDAESVPAEGGTISGAGTYAGGETVTLSAAAAAGYTFLNWSEYGRTVTTDAVYSFTANGNRALKANFRSDAGVLYVDANGKSYTCQEYSTIDDSTNAFSSGWYAASGEISLSERIEVSGNVNLILCDGAVFTLPKGIHLAGQNRLTIWGQSSGSGMLVIDNVNDNLAGIGGNDDEAGGIFTMNSGTLEVSGGECAAGIGGGGDMWATEDSVVLNTGHYSRGWAGTITINGGAITATGGERGAALGCGQRGSGGTVTINGGTITAASTFNAAAIGGGESSTGYRQTIDEVHINGGMVTATGCDNASAIGGGLWGRSGNIIIDGGTVTATTGRNSSGIGSGYHGLIDTITINGGEITSTGGEYGAGIGGCRWDYGTINITGGKITANGGYSAAGIGGGFNLGKTTYYTSKLTITGGEITANGGRNNGYGGGAGIGGGCYGNGGDITISGGTIHANGGGVISMCGAGIGGGALGDGGNITITGGTIDAKTYLKSAQINSSQNIGHGSEETVDGKETLDAGTLKIGTFDEGYCLRVGYGNNQNSATWVGVASRENACRYCEKTTFISPCQPHAYDIVGRCSRCGASGGPVLRNISYVNAVGQAQNNVNCEALTASNIEWNTLGACKGWYAATENVTIPQRVSVSGSVNLILCDGASLTIPKGIEVSEGNSLTIWRQENATGALISGLSGNAGDAGIGGSNGQNAGTVTVNGGNITAKAAAGAQAIGHGADAESEGSLVLHYMRVYESSTAANPVNPDQRETVCRSSYAKLTPCIEHQLDYGVCRYCEYHQDVSYLDPGDGRMKTRTDYSVYGGESVLTAGWYIVPDNIVSINKVTVRGDVHLILFDGMTWSAMAGVSLTEGSSLTLWAQSDSSERGSLIASGENGYSEAALTGGTFTFNGGTITATGAGNGAGITGTCTVRGGAVTAAGKGDGAGINGSLTVNNGTVTATGGDNGAGINGTVTMNNGTLKATGGENAAGVDSTNITINNGTVTAIGGTNGAGVTGTCTVKGGGVTATGKGNGAGVDGILTVDNGTVTATGGDNGAGITGTCTVKDGNVTATGKGNGSGIDGSFTMSGGTVTVTGAQNAHAIGSGGADPGTLNIDQIKAGYLDSSGTVNTWLAHTEKENACRNTDGSTVQLVRCDPHTNVDDDTICDCCGSTIGVPYYDPTDNRMHGCTSYTIYNGSTTLNSGWYLVNKSQSLYNLITISGDVNLILCDGVKLDVWKGIKVTEGNSLVFWSQTPDPTKAGKLTFEAGTDMNQATIGGSDGANGGDVTINGGTFEINGAPGTGAGIGGGNNGSGGNVTINGGSVNIEIKGKGAGIGGGNNGNGGNVKINGGTVKIKCLLLSAAIGGGATRNIGTTKPHGSLNIDGMRVGTVDSSNNVSWVTAENRISTCQGTNRTILLEPCTHENASYADNGDGTHSSSCSYCGTAGTPEAHSYDENHVCVCGAHEPNTALADGYYLIGPDWTVWSIDKNTAFAENPQQEGEYILETDLTEGDELKVVHVYGGMIDAWYPEGAGNSYVADAEHDGSVTIYFRPDCSGGDDWHLGCLYVSVKSNYICGDANGDGVVTIEDVTIIQRYLARYPIADTDTVLLCGDVDGDGVTITDVTAIQRYIAKFKVLYPIGEPIY